jgi:hypothetical protein
MKIFFFIRVLITLCLASSVSAQTVFVATNGSDTMGNGSSQSPWATISFAIDQVSDGTTINVAPGTYNGQVRLDQQFQNGILIRSSMPYKARLRHDDGAALICFTCRGVTVDGFDIAHATSNNGALVIQIQTAAARNVTLRNNIIHDSTNNDLLKVNNGTRDITIQGNIFYNQAGSDEHIDINSVENVTVLDNIFLNNGSQDITSSYVVVKDSNGDSDGVVGSRNISIRRNIFLNWQGNDGQSFVRVGEDGTRNFEAQNVLIENNLMLGNSTQLMRSALTIQGANDIRFQFNTVVGDLPSRSFAARLLATGANQPNNNIILRNNIWSDPTGSMGAEGFIGADVFDAPSGDNTSVVLQNNLYHNGNSSVPADSGQEVNLGDDNNPIFGDPFLPSLNGLVLPVYNGTTFGGSFSTIRDAFVELANRYGRPASGSPAIGAASFGNNPNDDLLGSQRSANPDLGAIEVNAAAPPSPPSRRETVLAWLLLLLE